MPVHIDTVGVSTTASAAAPSPLHLRSSAALLTAMLLSHLLSLFSPCLFFRYYCLLQHVLCVCCCDLLCCA